MALTVEELNQRAAYFKRHPTHPEKIAMAQLDRLPPKSYKFQHVCGFFILDFFIIEKCLAVEIDGASHDKKQLYDARRDVFINQCGLKVLRIPASSAGDIIRLISAYPVVYNYEQVNKKAFKIAKERREQYHSSVNERLGQGKQGPDYMSPHMKRKADNAPYKHQ